MSDAETCEAPSPNVTKSVPACEVATQVPDLVGDILDRQFRTVKYAAQGKGRFAPEGFLQVLTDLQTRIRRKRLEVEKAKAYVESDFIAPDSRAKWKSILYKERKALRLAEETFWEFNCADPLERARLRTLENLQWKEERDRQRAENRLYFERPNNRPLPPKQDSALNWPVNPPPKAPAREREQAGACATSTNLPQKKSRRKKGNRPNPDRRWAGEGLKTPPLFA